MIRIAREQNLKKTFNFLWHLKNSKSPGQLQTALTRLKPTKKCNNITSSSFPHTQQSQFSPFHSKFEEFSATYLVAPDQSQYNSPNSLEKKKK